MAEDFETIRYAADSASVIDLADLTGMPDGPPPREDLIDDWSLASFHTYFTAKARKGANQKAWKAGEIQAGRRGPGSHRGTHNPVHMAIVSALAGAEMFAPEEDRAWHAARLDAYTDAYGIKGWYRHTTKPRGLCPGRHSVYVNLLRTRTEGDRGRYFVNPGPADRRRGPARFAVVDRDTGRIAYRAVSNGVAQQWIEEHETATEAVSA